MDQGELQRRFDRARKQGVGVEPGAGAARDSAATAPKPKPKGPSVGQVVGGALKKVFTGLIPGPSDTDVKYAGDKAYTDEQNRRAKLNSSGSKTSPTTHKDS